MAQPSGVATTATTAATTATTTTTTTTATGLSGAVATGIPGASASAIRQRVSLVGIVSGKDKLLPLLAHLRGVTREASTPVKLHVNVFLPPGTSERASERVPRVCSCKLTSSTTSTSAHQHHRSAHRVIQVRQATRPSIASHTISRSIPGTLLYSTTSLTTTQLGDTHYRHAARAGCCSTSDSRQSPSSLPSSRL